MRASLLVELLTLFASGLVARFDRQARVLELSTRRLWRRRHRRIGFDEISYIDRDAVEVRVGSEDRLCAQPRLRITLFLQLLPSGEKIALARFFDDKRSRFLFGGPAWEVLGEAIAEVTSRPFGLHARISAQLEASGYRCSCCGRPAPVQRPSCVYCGGPIVRAYADVS